MTLPFICEDCGGPITDLTPDVAYAIYEARIAFCQPCLDAMEAERDAYAEEIMGTCSFDPERGRFVIRQEATQ